MPEMHRHHIPTIVWNAVRIASTVIDVDPEEIFDQNKRPRVVRARQSVVWGVRTIGKLSYPEIGQALDRDHTTIQNAYKRFCSALERGEPWADGMMITMQEQLVWGTTTKPRAFDADVQILKAVAAGCQNLTSIANLTGAPRRQIVEDVARLVDRDLLESTHDPLDEGRFAPTITLSPTGARFLTQTTRPKTCEDP